MANPETRERAEKIGRNAVQERMPFNCPHCSAKLFGYEDRCPSCDKRVRAPDPVRKVFDEWPLKRLSVRGIITRVQFNAGESYYDHWRASGLQPLSGVDMTRIGGSADPNVGMPVSMRQAEHRKLYRLGYQALLLPNRGTVIARYVDAIVLHEMEPLKVGSMLADRTDEAQARAVAIEFLKAGLDCLAGAYNLG